jgi:hypothetical protein
MEYSVVEERMDYFNGRIPISLNRLLRRDMEKGIV